MILNAKYKKANLLKFTRIIMLSFLLCIKFSICLPVPLAKYIQMLLVVRKTMQRFSQQEKKQDEQVYNIKLTHQHLVISALHKIVFFYAPLFLVFKPELRPIVTK